MIKVNENEQHNIRMHFGLVNAAENFQRFMSTLFRDEICKCVMVTYTIYCYYQNPGLYTCNI